MRLALLLLAILILAACGGGGGGLPDGTFVGRVLDVKTGGPISPAASVQAGATVQTRADGSFTVTAAGGSTTLKVDAGTYGVWTFTVPAASGTVDVGDLWVGPSRVTVTGRTLDASSGAAVSGAAVSFAGRTATTNAVGTFVLTEVAYYTTSQTAFWGILGTAKATGYFRAEFRAQPNVAVGGTVAVNDVLMSRTGTISPPPPPHTIVGTVSPAGEALGTVCTLKLGGTPIRVYTVGNDSQYYFWVTPETYTAEFQKGSLTATETITVTNTNEIIRRDVTLH